MASDASRGARRPGRVFDPAQAAAEWCNAAATLKKHAVRLHMEIPSSKDLMPQDVWLNPA
eukprot:435743-Alexandrium_andersonii.AAC.1